MSEQECINCGQKTNLLPHAYGETIRGCPLCGGYQYTGQVGNIAELYTEKYYNGDEYINYGLSAATYKRNFVRKLKSIMAKVPEMKPDQMRVLELGSATGDFMQVLAEHGVNHALGAEVSEYSRLTATKRGFRVIDPLAKGYMNEVHEFEPNLLCAWDVWEHLERPAQVFRDLIAANPSLRLIALTTVDSGAFIPRLRGTSWRQFHPPTHLAYPTRKSFYDYLSSVSFDDVSIESFGYYRPLANYLAALLPSRRMVQSKWAFRIPFYLNLYDIQLVLAKRKD
jgi:hypothetical protein